MVGEKWAVITMEDAIKAQPKTQNKTKGKTHRNAKKNSV